MDRYTAMRCIQQYIEPGQSITVGVTNARGRTLTEYYMITGDAITYTGYRWGGTGSLRWTYKKYCVKKTSLT